MYKSWCLHSFVFSVFWIKFALSNCHHGWILWRNTCFMISTVEETWIDAELHCRAFHAQLLEIPNSEINTFIKDRLKAMNDPVQRAYFIGGTDTAQEGNWEWNGSKTELDFTDWGGGQPDQQGHTENCLALGGHDQFRWHDYPCHDKLRFICASENA